MTKQHINTGQTPNDKSGDLLRTAFTKVNDNFDELYAAIGTGGGSSVTTSATAPVGPTLGDLWYDTVSGRTYVYYDSSWVDASPVDGAGISSTDRLVNGNAEVILENDGETTSVLFPTRGIGKIFLSGSEIGTTPAGEGTYSAPLVLSSFSNDVKISANGIGPVNPVWQFKTDGTLTLPPQDTTLTNVNQIVTAKIYRATDSTNGTAIRAAKEIWVGNEQTFTDIRDQDAQLIAGGGYTRPWTGMPSWEALPLITTYQPTGSQLPVPGGLAPAANNAKNAYLAWKELVSNIDIVSGDKTFSFENSGELRVPGVITSDDLMRLNSFATTSTNKASVIAEGDGGIVFITTGDGISADNTWTFGLNGNLTLPLGSTLGETPAAITVTIYGAGASAFNQTYTRTYGDPTYPDQYLGSNDCRIFRDIGTANKWRLREVSTDYYESDDLVTWTDFIGGADPAPTGTLSLKTTDITVGTNTWAFGADGDLSFPDGTTTSGKGITLPVNQSLTVTVSHDDPPPGHTNTFKINPESIKLPTGNGTIFSGTETAANAWHLDSANKTLFFPDAGDGVFPQIKYSTTGNDGMQLLTAAKPIKITVASNTHWTFGADGRLTLPATSSILTNETALNIATHPTTTYTFNQAYWAALNGDTARIFTPTFNAQYFACTVTANQNGAYTVAVTGTGNGFVSDNWFKIPGNELGGTTPANDMQITIATVDGGGGILTTTVTGTAVSKQWQFSTTGSLTLPDASVIASYKPVTVIAATTTAQTITDSASAAFIQFVETVDTAGAFSPGTFTAPYTGYYQINMSVYFSTTLSLTSTSFLLIDTNLDFTKQVRIIDGGWTGSYLHYSTVIPATAGDAIRVAFRQVSGGDVEISSGSRLTIHRVSIS